MGGFGNDRDRTGNLVGANYIFSQLNYVPYFGIKFQLGEYGPSLCGCRSAKKEKRFELSVWYPYNGFQDRRFKPLSHPN
jgi:hypothetical protein